MVQGIRKEYIFNEDRRYSSKKEYLKEIAIKLSKECNLTHEEIANKINVSKITRIINKK